MAVDVEAVITGLVEDLVDVVILVDDHHRDVAVVVLRDRDCRPGGDVDHGEAVQGVPVHPDHRLVVDGRGSAVVGEHVHSAGVSLQAGEHAVGLGASKVVHVHRNPHVPESATIRVQVTAHRNGMRSWDGGQRGR